MCQQFPAGPFGLFLGVEIFWVTSITTSHISSAGTPSILKPASNEMISDSVELWDTDVCFLHIQLMGTNVRLPNIHEIHPRLLSSLQGGQQSLSLEINPVDNAEPCYPHDHVVGIHLRDECMKSVLPIVCRKPESILWLLLQVCWQTIECLVSQFVPGTRI